MIGHFSKTQPIVDSYLNELRSFLFLPDMKIVDEKLLEEDVINLLNLLEEADKELALTKLENLVLEDFLEKHDKNLAASARLVMFPDRHDRTRIRFASHGQSFEEKSIRAGSSILMSRLELKSFGVSTVRSQLGNKREKSLNYKVKQEITEKLITEIEEEVEKAEKKGKAKLVILWANIKELNLRISELVLTAKSFEEIVVGKETNSRNTKISMERYLRYFDSWLINGMALLSSLRFRLDSVNKDCFRQHQTLVRKREMYGSFMPVDVDEMKMTRDELLKKLEDKKKHKKLLKSDIGHVSTLLSYNKKTLLILENQFRDNNIKISTTKREIEKVCKEGQDVKKVIDISMESVKNLEIHVTKFEAPKISEYIRKKNDLQILEKEEKQLKRKNSILSMKLKYSKQNLELKKPKYEFLINM